MKIAINRNVPIPAYQQVVDGIAGAVARGDFGRGSRLPSVRNLAVDLGLNVNTVARAYRDLERAGVVQTMPGMGTFVADDTSRAWSGPPRSPAPAGGAPPQWSGAPAPPTPSWRELLAAARVLASAEGLSDEEFCDRAAELARTASDRAQLVVAASAPESGDLLRSLPTELAAQAASAPVDRLLERVRAGAVRAVLTTFPALPAVRLALGELSERVALVPAETELTEPAMRALSALPSTGKLALVTVEKEHWDHEANDVLKIIGRSRWLKMILLEGGERGLAERLEQVDCVLFAPRARRAVERCDVGSRVLVELTRQLTARTRERLAQALSGSTPSD